MERILRQSRLGFAALLAAALTLGGGAAASAAPTLDSLRLDRPAVVGRDVQLSARATDPRAPVSGLVTTFPSEGSYGTSSCAATSQGSPLAGAFGPGSVTLAAPQNFGQRGAQQGSVRLISGGCRTVTSSAVRQVQVTPTLPGEKPVPVRLLGITLPIDLTKPGGLSLPPLGEILNPLLGNLGVQAAMPGIAASCPGANRRIGSGQAGRKRSRVALLCVVNRYRASKGLRPLRANPRLRRAARNHSRSMVNRRYFSHVQPGGVDLIDRLFRTRYLPSRRWVVGENLATGSGRGGYVTPARVLAAWIRSTPHRIVMSQRRFKEAGVAIVSGAPSAGKARGFTYTFDFGYRRR